MKKVLFSAVTLVAVVTSAIAANTGQGKNNNDSKESQEDCSIIKTDDFVGTCYGAFNLTVPGTNTVKYIIKKSTTTANEQDCFDWVSKQTLVLADANPSYDVSSSGSYSK